MFEMIIANLLGTLSLFYFLWKKLKDDYHFEKIFNLGFTILSFQFVGILVSRFLLPQYWFWINLLLISIGFGFSVIRQKIKFFESFDGLVVGLLPWLGFYFFAEAIKNSSLVNFVGFWIVLMLVFIFLFLDSQYRKYTWYKSGKVGFSGVVTSFIFFLIRSILGFFFAGLASFSPNFESLFSGAFAFLFLLLLYRLATFKE